MRTRRGDTPAECFAHLDKVFKGVCPVTVVCYSDAGRQEFAKFFKSKGKRAENVTIEVGNETGKNDRTGESPA